MLFGRNLTMALSNPTKLRSAMRFITDIRVVANPTFATVNILDAASQNKNPNNAITPAASMRYMELRNNVSESSATMRVFTHA